MKKIFNAYNVAAALVLLAACHKTEVVDISKPNISAGQGITSDTLSGTVKGTMLTGHTYYFRNDITVNAGDTLLMQPGVTLISLGTGGSAINSPQITVNGTFISLGTQDQPNYITTLPSNRTRANAFKGYWGGIQCGSSSGDLVVKWTHLEYAGGPAGAANDPAVYKAGDPRYTIVYANLAANFVLEDSWITNSKDDGVRTVGGKISIMRNTFEMNGEAGGEAFNMKSGTVGDLAYNLIIGAATNGIKASNSGNTTVQCNVNVYNNTMVNCGFRQVKSGRGGSINFEAGARGKIYNNLVVNCRFGIRITTDADIPNIAYDNQFYYANTGYLLAELNATAGVAVTQPHDKRSTTAKENKPNFASYNVDQFDYSVVTPPLGIAAMPAFLTNVGVANFRLLPGSPAINGGKTNFTPIKSVTATGNYGPQYALPGVDMGAYQADGSGNKQN